MLARKRGFVIRPSFYRFADMVAQIAGGAPLCRVPEVLFLLGGKAAGLPNRDRGSRLSI